VNRTGKFLSQTIVLSMLIGSSAASAARQPTDQDCLACHASPAMSKNVNGRQISLSVNENEMKHSVHAGLFTCVDCHPPANNAASKNHRQTALCADCHADEQTAYEHSLHARKNRAGATVARCEDCHGGAHQILMANDAQSPVNHANIPATCGRCHGQKFLMESNGQSVQPFVSYQQSVHGLAVAKGSKTAAVCTDCHGAHEILAASDPRSTTNRVNLPATCGKCHAGVNRNFALTRVHAPAGGSGEMGSLLVRWVRWFYLALIFVVIGLMSLHNAIVWRGKALARRKSPAATRRAMRNPAMSRMSANQRWQHLVLLSCFIMLAITGFSIKFSSCWFARMLGLSGPLLGLIHRLAGVILIGDGIYHLFYLAMTPEGRRMKRDAAPALKDASDAWETMRYYLRLDREKPEFGRFSYAGKAEYWALVWGIALLAITGVMMWTSVSLRERWWVDVATAIHFYEAILALLGVLVWHFFQVFLGPDVYPMNRVRRNGRMPVEQSRREHELDTKTLAGAEAKAAAPGEAGASGASEGNVAQPEAKKKKMP
jgi:cytochrome b subunit of formate dehydrogenase